MSNPTISFRISNYHLARGLKAIRQIDPNWQLTTPSNLIRTIFNDYIAKSEHHNNTNLAIDQELLQEIILSRAGRTKQQSTLTQLAPMPQLTKPKPPTQEELEQDKLFKDMKRESLEKIKQQSLENNKKESSATDTQIDQQIDEQINSAFQSKSFPKPSAFNDPNITDSEISAVTDFSPPKDWTE